MNYIWVDDAKSPKVIQQAIDASLDPVHAVLGQTSSIWDFNSAVPLYTLPVTFMVFLQQHGPHHDQFPNELKTHHVFNFMVNKKMDHRYLTLRLIQYFGLSRFDYTYTGTCENINDDQIYRDIRQIDPSRRVFTDDMMYKILGPVTIPSRLVALGHTDYAEIWKHGLKSIFQESLVSLITESDNGDYGPVSVFTEKTVYALAGATLPIWPGSYRNAEQLAIMGFDVFDDVINHGYQFETSMFMRCYRAIQDNLDLLQMDIAEARELRRKLRPRLAHNHAHLRSDNLLGWYHDQLKTWPNELRDAMCQRHAFLR